MHPYDVLKRPVITEKSNFQSDVLGQYTFEVDRRANKRQIKEAVETVFAVTVESVRVMNVPAKRVSRY
jgi:large subunit ribosomal protein L23